MENVMDILKRIREKQLTLANSSGKVEETEKEYECLFCFDRGVIICGEGDKARICKCSEQKRLENLFKSSQITPEFRQKTFDKFIISGRPKAVKDMFDCARDYAEKFDELRNEERNWMVLLGEPGSGKTYLSIAVANELMKKGIPVLYFQHVEGMSEIKDLLKQDKTLSCKLEQMKKTALLIWDDLFWGKGSPRDFELEITFEVLNYRYLNCLPTILNSNHTPSQLYEINKTIGSRIIERSKSHMVLIQGLESNYRLIGNG
ncbi:MAG: ATP-binding protein [Bacillota bacterium]|nr:ATP-binding protein [Bacillota bacterium]